MQIGIDTFLTTNLSEADWGKPDPSRVAEMLEEVRLADQVGLDVYAIGEHHRPDFVASSPTTLLAAAAAVTKNIRLGSAVSVLSSDDPIRLFQQFATVDLISGGRAEMVIGRGSFIESYPLFGYDLRDYDKLFSEKLSLLLAVRENVEVEWKGTHRPPLTGQGVYPRPVQNPLPIRIGVGGSPESVVRAGTLGLPLVVAIIGGQIRQFRPLIDLYREAGRRAGHAPEKLEVGVHAVGFLADTKQQALDDLWPYYQDHFGRIGRERGWPPTSRAQFEASCGPSGAYLVGDADEVSAKIIREAAALGGIDRISLVMNGGALMPQEKMLHCIELLGTKVAPRLREAAKAA
ncbi:LLM class flavin-dependent oxidoreductase [Acetobacteraceae bacterium H6797]|nr:LLM class flavin-dependent oxidoreductase [Acetobacteraceae bacterium H6797]